LFAFYIIFVSLFIYVDRIYKPSQAQTDNSTTGIKDVEAEDEGENEGAPSQIAQTLEPSQTQTSSQKIFTTDELSKYDGQDGSKAYVAIDGTVYDVTPVFENGYHFGHFAGRDLSNQFYTRHVKSSISKYPVVGTLI
jgi:predicted heme/steroid binding protein